MQLYEKFGRENEWIVSNQTKLSEYEKEWKEREQLIKNLDKNVSVMNKKVENFEKEMNKHEHYSRRNCLLVHGIVKTISTKMYIEISPADLDRTHRIGKKKAG